MLSIFLLAQIFVLVAVNGEEKRGPYRETLLLPSSSTALSSSSSVPAQEEEEEDGRYDDGDAFVYRRRLAWGEVVDSDSETNISDFYGCTNLKTDICYCACCGDDRSQTNCTPVCLGGYLSLKCGGCNEVSCATNFPNQCYLPKYPFMDENIFYCKESERDEQDGMRVAIIMIGLAFIGLVSIIMYKVVRPKVRRAIYGAITDSSDDEYDPLDLEDPSINNQNDARRIYETVDNNPSSGRSSSTRYEEEAGRGGGGGGGGKGGMLDVQTGWSDGEEQSLSGGESGARVRKYGGMDVTQTKSEQATATSSSSSSSSSSYSPAPQSGLASRISRTSSMMNRGESESSIGFRRTESALSEDVHVPTRTRRKD